MIEVLVIIILSVKDLVNLHKSNILDKPVAYVSNTDKIFDKIMKI